MIRELATVVAYENGVATVSCQQKSGCSGCASASQCGMSALEKLTGDNPHQHTLQLTCREPLQVGQQVEIGISERSLLTTYATGSGGFCGWVRFRTRFFIGGGLISFLLINNININ